MRDSRIERWVVVRGVVQRPRRIIGHPDLADGRTIQRGDTLYVSIAEAIYLESRGETVELHFAPTVEDEATLAEVRDRARRRWANDPFPDGWTHPTLPMPVPTTGDALLPYTPAATPPFSQQRVIDSEYETPQKIEPM